MANFLQNQLDLVAPAVLTPLIFEVQLLLVACVGQYHIAALAAMDKLLKSQSRHF